MFGTPTSRKTTWDTPLTAQLLAACSRPHARTWLAWLLMICAGTSTAQTISFPSQPLYLTTAAKPNLIMAIDNSGSTDFEFSLTANDGSLWWYSGGESDGNVCPSPAYTGCGTDGTNDINAAGTINFNIHGRNDNSWHKFAYLFPDGSGSSSNGSRAYGDSTGHYGAIPLLSYAWTRSPNFNKAYFDPAQTYLPWVKGDGTSYAASTPSAAPVDPILTSPITFNLTQDVASNTAVTTNTGPTMTTATGCTAITAAGSTDWGFRVYNGMTLPAGTCYTTNTASSAWKAVAADSTISSLGLDNKAIWVRYFPATFYLPHGTALPAGYGYSASVITGGKAPDGSALDGYEIKPGNFTDTTHYNTAIGNFANWFTYYRKRMLALRGGIGSAFNSLSGIYVGEFPINDTSGNQWSSNISMYSIDTASQKQTFYTNVYGLKSGGGTPTRPAVEFIGNQFRRTDSSSPIQYACQQNFGILFTDGYANSGTLSALSSSSCALNADGSKGAPYQDTVSGTMGDEAMCDFVGPLQPSSRFALGGVPVPSACSSSQHDAALDCNTNLHEDFYGVILNTKGLVYGVNAAATANPYASTPTWPTSTQLGTSYSPAQVDDLWHATVNGHGLMFNATTPKEIADDLNSVLSDIVSRTSSASAVALNSGSLNSGTQVFQARFNSGDWSGQLLDFPVSSGSSGACPSVPAGQLCAQGWDAAAVLDAKTPSSRVIVSYNPDNRTAVPFRWDSNLGTTNQTLLNADPSTGSADGYGSQRLDYVRGVRTYESSGTPQFRQRSSVLGDIIDSDPYYVGIPPYSYTFNDYAGFRQDQYDRTPIVYVGANDGMMHGFRVSDGQEVLAYVPSDAYGAITTVSSTTTVSPLLGKLTQPSYRHAYTVDGSPTIGDAYIGGSWHSILASGLRFGGQGIFALDVTDPSLFSEANAARIALWEFTDTDDADLGYTFSQPAIAKMANGRWAVIIGNGYNSSAADGHASTTGKATLFILFLDHVSGRGWTLGSSSVAGDYYKITLNSGTTSAPNGLATPAVVDIDGDGVADRIYAGDLQGNLWRIDATDTDPSRWASHYGNNPLFVAKDASGNRLPITERPDVGKNSLTSAANDVVVYFGTGRYLDSADNTTSNQNTQSFFGIFDNDSASATTITRSTLQQQKITSEVTSGSSSYRITTANTLDPVTQYGWYIDLILDGSSANNGERQVSNPTLRGGRIIFTTLIPPSGACAADGGSWLMELNALSGARTTTAIFDVNQDGTINTTDNVNGNLPSGVKSTGGIMSRPTILAIDNQLEVKLISEANGQIATISESAAGRLGRVSWRELVP